MLGLASKIAHITFLLLGLLVWVNTCPLVRISLVGHPHKGELCLGAVTIWTEYKLVYRLSQ